MRVVFAQVMVCIMTIENQREHWWVKETQTRYQAKLLMSKAMTFSCRKYLTQAFWVASYTVVFQNKQINKQTKMLHRKKITPIYSVANAAIVECTFKTSIRW